MSRDKPGEATTRPQSLRTDLIVALLLFVSVWLIFGQTLRAGFINYDDDQYVYENPKVVKGLTLDGIAWAFTHSHASNWHPLTWISHMLDVELYGINAGGPHLTNILLHGANAVLLLVLLQRLTGARWRSALVAALFAVHPLHVESVAWISERKDVLSGFFGLLTLMAYERYVRANPNAENRKTFYWLTFLFLALGLVSKPMLVTLPFLMLLLDYWPLGRLTAAGPSSAAAPEPVERRRARVRQLLKEKVPFFVLSLGSCVATLAAQQAAVQPLTHISMDIRAMNAVVSYARYLYKTIWPVNLALPYLHSGYGAFWLFCIAAVMIVAMTFMVVRLRRRFPFLIVGWFWYLGMLVPVIGLVQVGMQSLADRYMYLPSVGVFILLTWGAGEFIERFGVRTPVIWGGAILILGAISWRGFDQARYWQNTETLFRHTLKVEPSNHTAHYNLGCYYFGRDRLDEAIEHFRAAIRLKPDYEDALANLGVALARNGQLEEAIDPFHEAIRYQPNKADTYYNLGNVLVLQRRLDEAAAAFREALQHKPDYPEAHNNLANVLLMQGDTTEAVRHYQEALRLDPNHEKAQQQLRSLGVPIP